MISRLASIAPFVRRAAVVREGARVISHFRSGQVPGFDWSTWRRVSQGRCGSRYRPGGPWVWHAGFRHRPTDPVRRGYLSSKRKRELYAILEVVEASLAQNRPRIDSLIRRLIGGPREIVGHHDLLSAADEAERCLVRLQEWIEGRRLQFWGSATVDLLVYYLELGRWLVSPERGNLARWRPRQAGRIDAISHHLCRAVLELHGP